MDGVKVTSEAGRQAAGGERTGRARDGVPGADLEGVRQLVPGETVRCD